MKLKIIIIFTFFSLIVIGFYLNSNKKEYNYTILGDKEIYKNNIISKNFTDLIYDKLSNEEYFGRYNEDFIFDDIRIIDIINQIEENKQINNNTIQNILKNTDILIIFVGNNEINYKLSKNNPYENNDKQIYTYLDQVENDMLNMIKLIKKYNNSNIILLGLYNDTNNLYNDRYYEYINKKIQNISLNNNIIFINTYDILNKNSDNLTKTSPVYITNEGNMALFNKIYSKIDKLYLHKIY